jgi:hypothetical protein
LLDDPAMAKAVWGARESGLGASAFVPGKPDHWTGWEDSAVPPDGLGAYLRELRVLGQRRTQSFEIAAAERHRAAPRRTTGRVGEAQQPLAALVLEQLHDRREALLARPLRDAQLLDQGRRSPGCRRLRRHERQRS